VAALRESPGREVEPLGVAAHVQGDVVTVEEHRQAVQALSAGHHDADHERVAGFAGPRAGRHGCDARGGDELERDEDGGDGQGDERDDPEAMMRCERDCQSSGARLDLT